jgi:hypothetical protein
MLDSDGLFHVDSTREPLLLVVVGDGWDQALMGRMMTLSERRLLPNLLIPAAHRCNQNFSNFELNFAGDCVASV